MNEFLSGHDWYMRQEVVAALAQILPVFFLAYLVEQGFVMANRIPRSQMTGFIRRVSIASDVFLWGIIAVSFFLELALLLVMNGGDDAHGPWAFLLWFVISFYIAMYILSVGISLLSRRG